ncbi:unnamed protein product [Fraxinus pennsylvanica]|uniref:RRM domain-containing protein n=1 Tax=Fraxinus pennsylvanica TaxID=56036 RepID=A0AAD2DQD6_9LAMI|nr:unnamed protein product [Fraxinus pennsylvanica]
MDESLQGTDSHAGSSSLHRAPSMSSVESATDPMITDPTSAHAFPLGSHPMLTQAKAGIFKTRHPANLGILGSSGLLSALLDRYGFVEFSSHAAAEKVLQSYNGTMMPNVDQTYCLNWAAFSSGDRRPDAGSVGFVSSGGFGGSDSDLLIFVGDLASDVTDVLLHETFASRYPSVKGVKMVVDSNFGCSKEESVQTILLSLFIAFVNSSVFSHCLRATGVAAFSRPCSRISDVKHL